MGRPTIINEKKNVNESINVLIGKSNQTYYNLNNTVIGKKEGNNKTKITLNQKYKNNK